MVQTVVTNQEKTEVMTFPNSSLDDHAVTEITIQGQSGGLSYEDRSVYLSMKSGNTTPDGQNMGNLTVGGGDLTMWLQGEQAIEFGIKLIEHGKFALEANMIGHQLIHAKRQYDQFLEEGRVEEVEFKVIDETPANYGSGFRTYAITPLWNEGMAPEYQEDFCLEHVIYWSPFEAEYADQLDHWTRGLSYSFIGYDHEEEVRIFEEQCREMSAECGAGAEVFEVAPEE